ncbi:MAG: 30S ribosomal protein S4e [Thermoprotei archaeon]|nr:MAG: 30S ribosomal protein S4e [Thermoprotei archaeon]
MARMGGMRHLKRLAAPHFWPILRKEYVWVVKPRPGPHPIERSIPLLVLVRDVLGYAETAREARRIIAEGKFWIDGVPRKDYKFPVGLMDVISIPETDEHYRMVPHPQKYLWPLEIPKEEAGLKLVRIENKTTVKGGHIQLNLHDGRNILVRVSNPSNPAEDTYKTMDSLLIRVPSQEIVEHIRFNKGSLAIVIDGRNVGRVGRVIDVVKGMGRDRTLVTLEDLEEHRFQTVLSYVFIIGSEKPALKLW